MGAGSPYALTKSLSIVSQCQEFVSSPNTFGSLDLSVLIIEGVNLLEIKVRNIPAKTVAALDELAKQNSQSREEYIRRLLEHHVMYSEVEGLNRKYETLVQEISQNMILTLNENTKALNEFIEFRKENS